MPTEHTVTSFEEDLKKLDRLIAEMGGMAEALLADAVDTMLKRDAEGALEVKERDKDIDALEREIDEHAIRLLALRQPVADDLRVVIVALKTAAIIERIGDYAKNIAKRTQVLSVCAEMGAGKSIKRLAALVQEMIRDVLDAYVTRDAERADEVRLRDKEVDDLHTSLFRELLTYMMEDAHKITPCTHLMFIAKNIERIGDHATNIAENVLFLVHGEMPEDARPKRDESVYVADPAVED
jgi:phosphate transport system protein